MPEEESNPDTRIMMGYTQGSEGSQEAGPQARDGHLSSLESRGFGARSGVRRSESDVSRNADAQLGRSSSSCRALPLK